MPDELIVRPQLTAVLAHRKASSSCCGALLDPGMEPEAYLCRGCGQPCARVLSDPVEVTAHG